MSSTEFISEGRKKTAAHQNTKIVVASGKYSMVIYYLSSHAAAHVILISFFQSLSRISKREFLTAVFTGSYRMGLQSMKMSHMEEEMYPVLVKR